MRSLRLDVRRSRFAIRKQFGLDADDLRDLVGQGKQLLKLFGRDRLILGSRIADDLILVHFLVRGQNCFRFQPLGGELGGQSRQIKQAGRRRLFQCRRVDDNRAGFDGDIDFLRRFEPGRFRLDEHIAILRPLNRQLRKTAPL